MDLSLDATESAVRDAVALLIRRHQLQAGQHSSEDRENAYDRVLEEKLREAGFLSALNGEDGAPMLATLIVEEAGRARANVSIASHAMVLPSVEYADARGPVALVRANDDVPARYVCEDGCALVVGATDVVLRRVAAIEPVPSVWGYVLARPELGEELHRWDGAAEITTRWWHIAVAAEIVGLFDAALACVVAHLIERVQFGRPLAQRQALQHRLAHLRVRLDGSRFLTYRAAWSGGAPEAALEASAYTTASGRLAVRELHQLCGAIGLTEEFELHTWTTRIVALCIEVGGPAAQQRRLAEQRWGGLHHES